MRKTISGQATFKHGVLTFVHPDCAVADTTFDLYCGAYPVYPLTYGLTNNQLIHTTRKILSHNLPILPEWIEKETLNLYGWPSWKSSILDMHNPKSDDDLNPESSSAYQRLLYDELLARQIEIARRRKNNTEIKGKRVAMSQQLFQKLKESLPFTLTNAQTLAIEKIFNSMNAVHPMRCLVQGDVGSGKTLVAFSASTFAVEAGFQVAFLAPTEVLAQQHGKKLKPYAEKLGLSLELMVGGKSRSKALKEQRVRLAAGSINILVGTHALLEENIVFQNLGLVIVDEQHRFGVKQRSLLMKKGVDVDMMAMSATPIPRSLQMTLFGDMDVIPIREKPKGRQPIHTSVVNQEKLEGIIEGVKRHTDNNQQVYWVCPLVKESEKLDLAAAEERFKQLYQLFGSNVGIIHGKMKSEEKNTIMQRFINEEIKILVATTVIEVGVDVPKSTLIVIEHAERFGLSQLHQLRGRVGRGSEKSHCVLVYAHPLTENAKNRLHAMRESQDGFYLAEEDLKLRGGGDVYGTQQSGYNIFKLADLRRDLKFLTIARDEAQNFFSENSQISMPLQLLSHIFQTTKASEYVEAG